jgi:type I restriction enzyme S subunit
MKSDALPGEWKLVNLIDCVTEKESWSPEKHPRTKFRYIELSGIDSDRGTVAETREVDGATPPSRAKKIVRKGDIIFGTTRPGLKNIAVIPEELDGEICSTGFCVLRPQHNITTSGWIFAICRSDLVIDQVIKDEEKSAYPAVSDSEILACQIPLPSMEEQCRIVSRIETINGRAQELIELTQTIASDMQRAVASFYERLAAEAPQEPLHQVASPVRRPITTTPDGSYPELGLRSFGKGTFHKPALSGTEVGNKRIFHIHAGDLVFSNVFGWEGAIAVAQPEDDGRAGSHRYITYLADPERATPEFLCFHFLTARGLEDIRAASPGSAGRNRTLGLERLKQIPVPVPPIAEQLRFSELVKRQREITKLANSITEDLRRFEAALLAKAFRGEL